MEAERSVAAETITRGASPSCRIHHSTAYLTLIRNSEDPLRS
ncbi:hypothetical protein HMPREF1162_1409 [ [[Propionibacterium] namnetense SK182B-JCVI]|uniref:Uncharacterized protein n=1 Tax=[Propionibacterium] namnetense SK182B-JCVI TaxID=1051006 RepID=F9NWP1_9ACTN|nr:hypothetical protein HMPREF1162_1409 [ [[Propionibacterium] namnetense SK182B-JCVI]